VGQRGVAKLGKIAAAARAEMTIRHEFLIAASGIILQMRWGHGSSPAAAGRMTRPRPTGFGYEKCQRPLGCYAPNARLTSPTGKWKKLLAGPYCPSATRSTAEARAAGACQPSRRSLPCAARYLDDNVSVVSLNGR
jgi:hypothetical protein